MRKPTRTEIMPTTYPRALEQALQVLKQGGLVAFPTDTVYGVGALTTLPLAVEQIYHVKGRPRSRPIPILLDSAESLEKVAEDIPPEAWSLADRFWPGPLTIILRRSPSVPDVITAGGPNVAVRVPDHEFVLRLLHAAGGALATTSANLSGRPDPVTAEEVLGYLEGRIDLILDGGRCPGGIASTVIDLTGASPTVVRRGPISPQELQQELHGPP
ncbi:MAG TPA: L-threonylcarbamoyladenylate synthase [Anaerolineae bacterium]|nr:L-threonylcarbamoyladenylate synthase [Anaerolineae bacterium]HUW97159.1 L-threonylcarbamoyladenylate synthase [Anaerolineae bacterium]